MPTLIWPSKSSPSSIPASLELDSLIFPQGVGYPGSPEVLPQNRLILGDNLAVMSALLPEYEERIRLIYADPPLFFESALFRSYWARGGFAPAQRVAPGRRIWGSLGRYGRLSGYALPAPGVDASIACP